MEIYTVDETHLLPTIDLMMMYFEFYDRDPPTHEQLSRHISRFYHGNDSGVQFIAYDDETPIGFATLYFTYSTMSLMPISIMNDLYVIEAQRGKGAADTLFDRCVNYSKSRDIHKMEWVTANDNLRAQKFYDRKGGQKLVWTFYDMYFK